jgi:iron complex outermembrane receptor protein
MEMRITSVSREEQDFLRTSAAVFVITEQDIRRSGATDIAEILRSVPGVQVAQISSSKWGVGVRGFNAQYSTKLLVLIDGRSVYDPEHSGVTWHLQSIPLEDIERIEVIRGPGATMWGANAVNGVISITTKRASRTQGGHADVAFGTGRPGEASVRFGGAVGDSAFYRVFAQQTSRSSRRTSSGEDGLDSWNMTLGGFRVDWDASAKDTVTIQGSVDRAVSGDRRSIVTSLRPFAYAEAGLSSNRDAHVLTRWTRSLANRSDVNVQFYYDRRDVTRYGAKNVETIDVDAHHSLGLGSRQHLTWGAGYRKTTDFHQETLSFRLTPDGFTHHLTSAFVQDGLTLVPEKLFLVAGSKFEHSTFSGSNAQPALRAVWQPTERQSLWAATARAVRTPNRAERSMRLNVGAFPAGNLLALVEMRGQPEARSEKLAAHEVGYRYQPTRRLWFDLAAYRNNYHDLSVLGTGDMFFEATPAPHLVSPLYFENSGRGHIYGAEIAAQYQATSAILIKGNYSALRMHLVGEDPTITMGDLAQQNPRQQGYIGSTLKLPHDVEVSSHVYMVGALPSFDVPAYTRIDLNTAWQPKSGIRVTVVGQNLLGSRMEFGAIPSPPTEVRRSVHAELTVGF